MRDLVIELQGPFVTQDWERLAAIASEESFLAVDDTGHKMDGVGLVLDSIHELLEDSWVDGRSLVLEDLLPLGTHQLLEGFIGSFLQGIECLSKGIFLLIVQEVSLQEEIAL